jgi:hypothetical protein
MKHENEVEAGKKKSGFQKTQVKSQQLLFVGTVAAATRSYLKLFESKSRGQEFH